MGKKIENLWLKLLIAVLIVCGILIILGYLYYRNSSCGISGGNVWDCFEFEIIIFGGGILLFSLPIIVILFLWELYKKIQRKREENEDQTISSVTKNLSEPNVEIQKIQTEKEPEDELSKNVLKYAKGEKDDNN